MGYGAANPFKTPLLTAVLLAVLLGSAGRALAILAPAPGLEAAPADAAVIVYTPSLAELSGKAAMLNAAVGAPPTPLADLLGLIKTNTGLINGLDENGPAMVVLGTLDAPKNQQAMIVVPVADWDALVGNYGGDATAPIASGTISGMGTTGYLKKVADGRFAVMGLTETAVAAYEPDGSAAAAAADRLGSLGGRTLGDADLAILINVEDHREAWMSVLSQGMAAAETQAAAGGDAMAGQMVDLYGQAMRSFLRDARAAVVAMDMTADGLGMSFSAQTAADSPWGKLLTAPADGESADLADLLNRVPGENYLMALAIDHRAIHMVELMEQLATALDGVEQMRWVAEMIERAAAVTEGVQAQTATYAMPAGGFMAMMSGLKAVSLTQVTDPDAYMAQTQAMFESLNGLAVALPGVASATTQEMDSESDSASPSQPSDAPMIRFQTTFRPEAVEVEGVKLASYSTSMQMPPQLMAEMGPMAGMMGASSSQGYIGVKNGLVLTTTTLDLEAVREALVLIDNGQGVGTNAGLTAVREAGLLEGATVQGYLNVNAVVDAINGFIAMMGMPPLELAADLPPLGFGAVTGEGGLTKRVYLPLATISAVAEAGMNMQAQMMQMQGGQTDDSQGPPF